MSSVKVSVIVPVFNKSAFIARCVRSILNQSLSDFELIIVNDGSTDDSMGIVAGFSDPRIKVHHQRNSGPGAARNFGIKNSSAQTIAFLDADDEWLPTYLEESVALLDLNARVACVTSGYFEYPAGHSSAPYWSRRGITDGVVRVEPELRPEDLVSKLAYMSCWSTVVRREVINRLGGFYDRDRCRYAEDSFLWLKVLLNEPVRFSTVPRVRFHREASDLSNIRSGPRPIEPFLLYPDLVRDACPSELRDILDDLLAIRAFKTSCMLGSWGKWREARNLFRRFMTPRSRRLALYYPALFLTNRFGAGFAKMARSGADLIRGA